MKFLFILYLIIKDNRYQLIICSPGTFVPLTMEGNIVADGV